ncbi:MAG: hypothetical protein ACK56W_19250 [Pirellula sp.]|nr:hypothetical protein [Pirellula sp.]
MSDLLFHTWLLANGFDQERWMPGLLRALRKRFEKSQERLVIDGECQWPQRVHRVSETKENA